MTGPKRWIGWVKIDINDWAPVVHKSTKDEAIAAMRALPYDRGEWVVSSENCQPPILREWLQPLVTRPVLYGRYDRERIQDLNRYAICS